jgi:MFS family permease
MHNNSIGGGGMNFKKLWVYPVSLLGAIGTGLQNYMGVTAFIQGLMSASFAAGRTGLGLMHGIAAVLGGVCSTLANFCVNIELLEDFYERLTQKPKPQLEGWQKFRYYAGSGIFIGTGLLFGLTAVAFGPVGPLAVMSIIAGIFVSAIMIIQELETWLSSFDKAEEVKKPLSQLFKEWKHSLTRGKMVGVAISIGNVFALSLLFTIGLASFFVGVGVPALTALIAGAAVSLTGGAFTEFYFYNRFLSHFCDKFKEKWQEIKKSKHPAIGLACATANALVNGALAYAGVFMITTLLTAASIAVPPLGALVAVATVTALFAGTASFILGLDFWIRNSAKLTNYFSKEKKAEPEILASDLSVGRKNTKDIIQTVVSAQPNVAEKVSQEEKEEELPASQTKLLSLHFVSSSPKPQNDNSSFQFKSTGTYSPASGL